MLRARESAIFFRKAINVLTSSEAGKALLAKWKGREKMNSYPRPQFKRNEWLSLNGTWSCCIDNAESGMARGFAASKGFETPIRIPFCPESRLSGLAHTDFINSIWYHRRITIPEEWKGREVVLHFGGVDYECEVFIDGISAGTHTGGAVSFELNISDLVSAGKSHDLVVYAIDHIRSHIQCFGKQSVSYANEKANYTRTTGIWSDVWMEPVSSDGLRSCAIVPDYDGGKFVFRPSFRNIRRGNQLRIGIYDGSACVGEESVACAEGIPFSMELKEPKEWSPDTPFLYGIRYTVTDVSGRVVDEVSSYAGLRKFHVEGGRCFLNNRPIFLRFVLDQGFYKDGIWTAPDEDAIRQDIELAKRAGFNGARLHQKIFDERYHYHAQTCQLIWKIHCYYSFRTLLFGFTAPVMPKNRIFPSDRFLADLFFRQTCFFDRPDVSLYASARQRPAFLSGQLKVFGAYNTVRFAPQNACIFSAENQEPSVKHRRAACAPCLFTENTTEDLQSKKYPVFFTTCVSVFSQDISEYFYASDYLLIGRR